MRSMFSLIRVTAAIVRTMHHVASVTVIATTLTIAKKIIVVTMSIMFLPMRVLSVHEPFGCICSDKPALCG